MFTTPFSFLAAPAGGGWTPLNLPGIENWFKSDTGITLNGSTVSAWQDSLTAKSVTQATPANQPAFTASNANFNNLPTVDFDNPSSPSYIILQNNTDFIYSGIFPLYFFIIARKTASIGGYVFAGGGSDANIGGGAWSIDIRDSYIGSYLGAMGPSPSVGGSTVNVTLLAGLGLTSTNTYAYFNNNSAAIGSAANPLPNPKFFIGGYDSNGYFNFKGSIAEVIITRGTELSGTDLSNLWSYVQTKYGI